ncbi:unnamed protein product [Aphis gossypii]|uniref:PDZ domain-containing protein n=1 Tax=Aphis gossypii TaxID=80765 RepID=A0A9P0JB85_APHGO|nr:unnamed protein product [Aphis gossypii]
MSTVAAKDFVTVVSVDGGGRGGVQTVEDSFVTVLSIGEDVAATDGSICSTAEEVLVYRLPGERLGFGLRFDGVDTCNRLFVQSCADGSPASRTQASWGPLAAGDEIVRINGRPVNRLSRDDCVRCLKESGLVVKLHMVDGRLAVKAPPPVPPRKQKKPEPPPPIASSTLYTDAVEKLFVYHGESESDDTNSSVSTVVSKCPAELSVGEDCDGVLNGGSDKNCVLDRVLEPFMQLEREFSSSAAIGDDVGLYEKLVAVAEEDRLPPKPLPRKEVRPPKKKPPPPPPPLPSSPPPPAYRLPPRLVDFVHKDEPPQTFVDTPAAADDDDVFAIVTDTITMPTSDEEITTAEQHNLKKECDAALERPENLTPSCKPDHLYSDGGCGDGDRGGSMTMKSTHTVAAEPSSRTDSETDSDGSRNFITTMTPKRTTSGRTDEVCNRSVRDKIAMFSRATATAAGGEKKDSSSSAYSTASADSSPAASPKAVAYSTLQRKPPPQRPQQQQYSTTASPSWSAPVQQQTADHRRSQSLVEQPYSKYFNTMNAYAEMGRSSLNALIEQRRRSMSKLRGLVIPEKVVPGSGTGVGVGDGTVSGGSTDESQLHPAAIPDLPLVIKIPQSENDDDDTDAAVLCPPIKTYVNEPAKITVTRRVNPVLRQSFMVVPVLTPASVTEQRRPSSASSSPSSSSSSSSTSSSLNSSREELRHIHDERPLSSGKSSNKGSFKADSDEDSALSSSRSSTSLQQYSPASSPSLESQQQQPPPLPSTSPPPPSTTNMAIPNHNNPSACDTGKRVLKAESVEAINRKNVLCSARISSGKPEPQAVLPSSLTNNYAYKTEYLPNNHHYHQHNHQQQQLSDGPALKSAKSGPVFATGTAIINRYTHNRMSSVESTTSDDSSMQYVVNAEPFGSISSLASSTSLISQQELQQLIDDANQTLEENNSGCNGIAALTTNPLQSVEVTVVILHRDMATSSVGITLAGGADYETKEITVYKVLAGSPADKDGRIRKGDRILSINGKSMKGITHRESLAILKVKLNQYHAFKH